MKVCPSQGELAGHSWVAGCLGKARQCAAVVERSLEELQADDAKDEEDERAQGGDIGQPAPSEERTVCLADSAPLRRTETGGERVWRKRRCGGATVRGKRTAEARRE